MLYFELFADQLPLLRERYISEKSSLVEILTLGWSSHANCMQNYVAYPDVIPNLIVMLESTKVDADNVQLVLTMLKNIVQASLDKDDQVKTSILRQGVEMDDELDIASES